jgi:hypothetical protein
LHEQMQERQIELTGLQMVGEVNGSSMPERWPAAGARGRPALLLPPHIAAPHPPWRPGCPRRPPEPTCIHSECGIRAEREDKRWVVVAVPAAVPGEAVACLRAASLRVSSRPPDPTSRTPDRAIRRRLGPK